VLAVAHVVARRGWWRGSLLAVMNADHVGDWNVAPRAHPNDGKVDAVEVAASMSLRHRWQARERLPQGTHVPHPSITVRTLTESAWTFERPMDVRIDGVAHGRATRLAVDVLADHFAIHV
jgi:diacylglycerol kinase family enzyme